MSDELRGRASRPANVQWRARRLLDEKGVGCLRVGAIDRQLIFDVLDDSETIRQWQLVPRRHRRAAHAAGDGPQQVAVGGDRLLGQSELEGRRIEVSRSLLEQEGRGGSVAIALDAVTSDTSPLVDLLAVRDPFARARKGGVRDLQLLRLELIAPLSPIHAELLDIGNETFELFGLGSNLDGVARVLLVWRPHERKLAARLHRHKQKSVAVRRELDLLLACEVEQLCSFRRFLERAISCPIVNNLHWLP